MNNQEWTIDDHNKSLAQGWMIIDNKELGGLRIIRNDDLDVFDNHRQALKHVKKMAGCGSKFHLKALKICGIEVEETRDSTRDGVHASHCCKHCGCKYGNENCPVVLGLIESVYPCETDHSRTFKMNADEVKQAINQLEVFRNYFHLNEETFYNEPFKKMLKFHRGNG